MKEISEAKLISAQELINARHARERASGKESNSNTDANRRDLEQIIVGIILRHPHLFVTIPLSSGWFDHFKKPIEAMFQLTEEGIEIGAYDVYEKLKEFSFIDGFSLDLIVDWQLNTYGAASSYGRYVEKLRMYFEDTGICSALETAANDINNGQKSTEVLSGMFSKLNQTKTSSTNFNSSMEQVVELVVNKIEEVNDAKASGGLGLKTGINRLDEVLGGLHSSDLVVVGARPGVGKTAFGLTVMLNMARQGKRIGFFSTEMSSVQVGCRMVAMESGVNAMNIRDASLSEFEYRKIITATKELSDYPIRICDNPSISSGEIMSQSRAWAMDGGLDFIVVDYLTRIRVEKSSGNQNLDVGEIVTGMKNIARLINIPVMCLAQLNRQSTQRTDKRPYMSDLRDSGIIEQEADQILMLYRENLDDNQNDQKSAEIIVEKNRHGQCKNIISQFNPQIMKWEGFQC